MKVCLHLEFDGTGVMFTADLLLEIVSNPIQQGKTLRSRKVQRNNQVYDRVCTKMIVVIAAMSSLSFVRTTIL